MIDEYNNIEKIIKDVEYLNHHHIEVGVLADGFLQMIAIVNNDGTTIPAKNGKYLKIPYMEDGQLKYALKESVTIPARRFLEKTIRNNSKYWKKMAVSILEQVMDGKIHASESLNLIGKHAVNDMKQAITDFSRPKNAPLTIANKGFNDPLIDKGTLRDSIAYRIVSN